MHHFAVSQLAVLAAVPDPGGGAAPPGSGGILTVLKWIVYVGLACSVAGLIASGIAMSWASRHGQGGEHAQKLAWVFGGAMIITGAPALITAVI